MFVFTIEASLQKGKRLHETHLSNGPHLAGRVWEMWSFIGCLAPILWPCQQMGHFGRGQESSSPSPSRVIWGVQGIMEINCPAHCLAPRTHSVLHNDSRYAYHPIINTSGNITTIYQGCWKFQFVEWKVNWKVNKFQLGLLNGALDASNQTTMASS